VRVDFHTLEDSQPRKPDPPLDNVILQLSTDNTLDLLVTLTRESRYTINATAATEIAD